MQSLALDSFFHSSPEEGDVFPLNLSLKRKPAHQIWHVQNSKADPKQRNLKHATVEKVCISASAKTPRRDLICLLVADFDAEQTLTEAQT